MRFAAATMTPVGTTARWTAAARAIESESARPLFADPLARLLAGELGFQIMAELSPEGSGGSARRLQPDPYLSIRTRFLDDALTAIVRDAGLSQVVLLAAGLDTRAFRLAWPAGLILYEIDRDEVFDWKEAVLAQQPAITTCERRVVRADLTGDWTQALFMAGFDPGRPAAFVAEGLLMYLQPDDVMALLAAITSISAEGSWIGIDAANPELATSPLMAGQRLLALGAVFQSTMTDPRLLFAEHGWYVEIVSPGHPTANYGRWPYVPVPVGVPGIPRAYFVTGRRGTAHAPKVAPPVSARSVEHCTWAEGCCRWQLLEHDFLGIAEKQMAPGAADETRPHVRQRQFLYVLAGHLFVDTDAASYAVDAGSGLEIPPLVKFRIRNDGPQAVRFLAIALRAGSEEAGLLIQ